MAARFHTYTKPRQLDELDECWSNDPAFSTLTASSTTPKPLHWMWKCTIIWNIAPMPKFSKKQITPTGLNQTITREPWASPQLWKQVSLEAKHSFHRRAYRGIHLKFDLKLTQSRDRSPVAQALSLEMQRLTDHVSKAEVRTCPTQSAGPPPGLPVLHVPFFDHQIKWYLFINVSPSPCISLFFDLFILIIQVYTFFKSSFWEVSVFPTVVHTLLILPSAPETLYRSSPAHETKLSRKTLQSQYMELLCPMSYKHFELLWATLQNNTCFE